MEHRWGERSKLNIPVQVDCGSRGLVLGVMRDASASGAFLCTAAQLPLLTHVCVEFSATPPLAHLPGVDAQVVRRAADGFGLEWAELAPVTIVQLLSASHTAAGMQQPRPQVPEPAPPLAAISPSPASTTRVIEETIAG